MSGIIGGAGSKSGVIGETEIDYEEGETTITLTPSVGALPLNTSNNKFSYIKIGDAVTFHGRIDLHSSSTVNGTGAIIGSLPFTLKSGVQYDTGNFVVLSTGASSRLANTFMLQAFNGTNQFRFYISNVNSISSGNANAEALQQGCNMYAEFTVFVI